MAIVKFDAAEWFDVYPEFRGKLSDAQLNFAFQTACLIIDNTDMSPIPYDPAKGVETRKILLWLLMCHLATLALRPLGQAGTLTQATEGTVSAGFTLPQSPNGDYFNQTPCGQTLWQYLRRFSLGGRYYDAPLYHPWG